MILLVYFLAEPMQKKLLAGFIAALFSGSTYAIEPFVIKDIRVEGIQRTEAGTIFSYLPVKVGDTLNDEKLSDSIKALFATGFFKDVKMQVAGDVLTVVVDERPSIATITFDGMKAFEKDQIAKALKEQGLAESRILDRALLDHAEQEIKRQYLSKGYYNAVVSTIVTPLERNRVNVSFNITEGDVSKITKINIIGAKAFTEKDLLDQFQLTTPGWFTWYTKNDQYSKEKLTADIETLKSFYLNNGYLEFNVESNQVSISPDKKEVFISITINEGEKYKVSSIKFAGNLLLPEDELRKLITVKVGDTFSRSEMNASTKAVSDRLGDGGYAFANVNPVPELDKEKHEAAFTIYIDPGKRVYVRQVNIIGNTKTRDEVVRREVRQMESGWYEGSKIAKSRDRIDRLGYFKEVKVETPPVPGVSDQVDVNYNVTEQSTGSLMLGAGFSQTEKLVLSGSISQQNIFGSGNAVALQVNTSSSNKVISLSYTNPYYTAEGISRGFDIYKKDVNTYNLSTSVASYKVSSWGGGVRYGIPIADEQGLSLGVAYDSTKLGVDTASPQRYQDWVATNGSSFSSLVGSIGWGLDNIDSRLVPTNGTISRVSVDAALPGGNLRYYRLNGQWQHFYPLNKTFTLMVNGEVSVANGYGNRELPFWLNYYAGGIGSVRGYESGTLGPIDSSTSESLGGNKRVVANAELLFPIPGAGADRSLRLGAFVDAGQVWGANQKVSLGDLRYSAGVSLAWSSPMGPLKFSFAKPINSKSGDKSQPIQFQMGTTF